MTPHITWRMMVASAIVIVFLGAAGYWGGSTALVTGVIMWIVGIVHCLVILREEEMMPQHTSSDDPFDTW